MATVGVAMCCSFIMIICFIIVGSVLMGVSVKQTDFLNVALKINSVSKQIEAGTVYTPGRYYIAPTYQFVEFYTGW